MEVVIFDATSLKILKNRTRRKKKSVVWPAIILKNLPISAYVRDSSVETARRNRSWCLSSRAKSGSKGSVERI